MTPSPEQIRSNFADIKPPLTAEHAVTEANRCLYCYNPPCQVACPTAIDIPEFIRRIGSGNLVGSAKTILESNILGASCARVCPTEVLCEGSCVFNELDMPPIDIGRLQRYATDHVMQNDIPVFQAPATKTGKVACIGGGPASLSCAAELGLQGVHAVVFDEKSELGGLNRWGIAPYKLTDQEAIDEVAYIQKMSGFEARVNTRIGRDITFAQLEAEYDAIFLGIGLGGSYALEIPGEDKAGVMGATEFIEELRSKPLHETKVGPRVVVVGAGNTAIDAATEAARLGAREVTIVYRRGREEMPAYEFEYELALKDAVRFRWLTQPVEVLGNGRVTGLRCQQMRLGEPDASGRARPEPVEGAYFDLEVDTIIKATGQEKQQGLLSQIEGLALNKGLVVVDEEFRTTNPRYFAGGDCINGGKEVVNAVYHGKKAAQAIARMIKDKVTV
jgi:dihydropyrimidine dehydrogenase (NAD+) subunit PreT